MRSNSLTIKNYSIALEALSRFPGAEDISNDLRILLRREVDTVLDDYYSPKPTQETIPDDKVPF